MENITLMICLLAIGVVSILFVLWMYIQAIAYMELPLSYPSLYTEDCRETQACLAKGCLNSYRGILGVFRIRLVLACEPPFAGQ